MGGREHIAELIGAVVTDVRVLLDAERTPQDQRPNVMMFYVLAGHLWGAALSSELPVRPAIMAGGLRQLQARCHGVLARFSPRIDAALREAEILDWDYRTA